MMSSIGWMRRIVVWLLALALGATWPQSSDAKSIWEQRGQDQPRSSGASTDGGAVAVEDASATEATEPLGIRVTTMLEARYDADGNGRVDRAEARGYLWERAAIARTEGRVLVQTQMEQPYDTNGDGVIDGAEAEVFLVVVGPE